MNRLFLCALCASAVNLFIDARAPAQIVLPSILGDHMVLQQRTDAPIWGWAAPGETVSITPGWGAPAVQVQAVADDRGRWRAALRTPAAGGPFTLTVSGPRSGTVALRDVLIGEVWLCSGQSNMEWPLRSAMDAQSEIAAADFPSIRLFAVENVHATAPRSDCRGAWAACTPQSAETFSAVGYFLGRELHRRLGVPIGLIASDWGGSVAEAWMSRDALGSFSEFAAELEMLEAVGDPARRREHTLDRESQWWQSLDTESGWTEPGFDDRSWAAIDVPSTWAGDLAGFDGVLLVRRTLDLDDSWQGRPATLELGPIDDYDDAWINGTHVGAVHEPGRWQAPRHYDVPAGVLRAGANVLSVRVLDTGGIGGINGRAGDLRLRSGEVSLELAGSWRCRRGRATAQLPPRPQETGAGIDVDAPSVLYNGMIAPLAPFAIAGVAWYQGESNRTRAAQYAALFPALIRDWRSAWGREVPFLFVQIAPFAYRGDTGQAALLREAQAAALDQPGTGMVVTLDLGERHDIHPRNKQEVGRRLARLALGGAYGQGDLVTQGPRFRAMRVQDDRAILEFDHADGGLDLRDVRQGRFVVAGADRRFAVAQARVEGSTLVAWSPAVSAPVAVRYAWEAYPEASLFNHEGLPAAPFRTDDWLDPLPPVTNDAEMESYRSPEPGFAPLFDGRTLDGWHIVNGAPSTWRARDGVIACSGFPTGVLRNDRHFENFVLELEWRHLRPGGNAGVFVWSDALPVRGQPFTRSVEVQVMDGSAGDGWTSDGDIFPIHGAVMTPAPECARQGSGRAFPGERRANPSPLWNHYRIECIDGSIALAVNGTVVTRGIAASPRSGYICLESEGSPIEFRNLRIRELPASTPAGPDQTAALDEGFVTLYGGVDLAGWRAGPGHEGHFRVSDWVLDCDGHGPDLQSEGVYRDFVLICDWRWPGTTPPSFESPALVRGSLALGLEAADAAPAGQWNRQVITMRGDTMTVVLNGRTLVEAADVAGAPREGPIALRPGHAPIQFANIFIRELSQ